MHVFLNTRKVKLSITTLFLQYFSYYFTFYKHIPAISFNSKLTRPIICFPFEYDLNLVQTTTLFKIERLRDIHQILRRNNLDPLLHILTGIEHVISKHKVIDLQLCLQANRLLTYSQLEGTVYRSVLLIAPLTTHLKVTLLNTPRPLTDNKRLVINSPPNLTGQHKQTNVKDSSLQLLSRLDIVLVQFNDHVFKKESPRCIGHRVPR